MNFRIVVAPLRTAPWHDPGELSLSTSSSCEEIAVPQAELNRKCN